MVADLLRLAAEDARRAFPALLVRAEAPGGVESEDAVPGSPEGLRMALANAVTNAVRHGRASRVWLRARVEGGEVVVDVDDDGVGVPVAEREAVLRRFVRGSTAASPGSGLGLALIAQQAARHGGTVTLERVAERWPPRHPPPGSSALPARGVSWRTSRRS